LRVRTDSLRSALRAYLFFHEFRIHRGFSGQQSGSSRQHSALGIQPFDILRLSGMHELRSLSAER
jgi:hypothetical protein